MRAETAVDLVDRIGYIVMKEGEGTNLVVHDI